MEKAKRGWDLLPEDKHKAAVGAIIAFFKEERGEEIGVIAAEALLDFFQERVGKDFYNKGVEDAKALIKERMEDVEVDIDGLQRLQ